MPFPINWLKIFLGYQNAKIYKKIYGNDTMNTEKWSYNAINMYLDENFDNGIFGKGLRKNFYNGAYKKFLFKYNQMLSLRHYLYTMIHPS